MTKKQHYMTPDERQQLEALLRAKLPITRIAQLLGFCRQTIYNEIKSGTYLHACDFRDEPRYSAQKAQQRHDYNQTAKGRALKIGNDHAYAQYLERKIVRDRYSPAAALMSAYRAGFHTTVCVTTLYNYIEKGVFLHLTNKHLWQKSKRKKRGYQPVQRIAHPLLPNITQRPDFINYRLEYGHWEMDLIVGKAKTRAVLLTLTERLSR